MSEASYRFYSALAAGRITFDLLHSLLRPLRVPAPPEPLSAAHHLSRRSTKPPRNGERPLRLMSWNIHRFYRPSLIAESLRALIETEDPDLILLQEVPISATTPFWDDPMVREILADFDVEFAAMHRVKDAHPYYPFTLSGQATLSRIGVADARVIALPTVSRPKLGPLHDIRRIALLTHHEFGKRRLQVINLHLENTTGPQGRLFQIQHLLDSISDLGSVVLGGDFNTIFGMFEKTDSALAQVGFSRPRIVKKRPSFPRLDAFYADPSVDVRATPVTGRGSDHQPIAIEVDLNRDSPEP